MNFDQHPDPSGSDVQAKIYSVSDITFEIKSLLEERFPFIWIIGEISNFRVPVSGHFYFTLKDAAAQINAVMFRGQNRKLNFTPEDGMQVVGLGRISLYEPRGTYQILFKYLEPKGIGALQIAFEQLKARLAAEGLFDDAHKIQLPFLPRKICLLTSPTGAVVHDMLTIMQRRFPNVHIDIIPIKVQGDGAVTDIVNAIDLMNRRGDSEVAVLARGGGSLEDLHAFNSEPVARAIFASAIPMVSAVGHETDFTIADFVSDLRAPTPSAAAELIVPLKDELERQCFVRGAELKNRMADYVNRLRTGLAEMSRRLVDPQKKLADMRLKTDDVTTRLIRWMLGDLARKRERSEWRIETLYLNNPIGNIENFKAKIKDYHHHLALLIQLFYQKHRQSREALTARLGALNPSSILERGYSITRTIPDGKVVRNTKMVHEDQRLDVMLARGNLTVKVIRKAPEEDV